ncbi:NAD(P)H nitroreductase [Clostridium sp. MCC353]|uniref:nitroreductase family protein n=1 Tax=Clostridium sp. MCC353 TaxID=2592646 RepID=UPI001C0205F5|nr:nitroreductase [Clostridium sp. MCC353]MBT9779921.1 NAD(P)H nitroreductase [Clostridium sp. MCC353]
MNQVMENILTRRSVRAFKDEKLSVEALEELAKAGIYAPSAMNRQSWKFTVVTNGELIQRLAKAIGTELGREEYDLYKPAALIIPSNHKKNRWGREDNACALQNIFLAAHSMGISSVWINQLHGICDQPGIRELLNEMEIPEDHVVYGMAALGYAADEVHKEAEKTGQVHFVV